MFTDFYTTKKEEIYKTLVEAIFHLNTLEDLKINFPETIIIDVPKSYDHGDFFTNLAQLTANSTNLYSAEMAKLIVSFIENDDRSFENIYSTDSGFINFKLSLSWINNSFLQMNHEFDKYFNEDITISSNKKLNQNPNMNIYLKLTHKKKVILDELHYTYGRIYLLLKIVSFENYFDKEIIVDQPILFYTPDEIKIVKTMLFAKIITNHSFEPILNEHALSEFLAQIKAYLSKQKFRGRKVALLEKNILSSKIFLLTVIAKYMKIFLLRIGYHVMDGI